MLVSGFYVKTASDIEDYKRQIKTLDFKAEKRFEEIEKDIRILKTDSYISKNGFEGGN